VADRGGFVSLVGAGPGDPGLLTRKGEQRIREADLIVYDQLVAPPILAMASPECEMVHRKELGEGEQSAINDYLVRMARRGHRIVRLKGGDPFVFGRGAEEAATLADAGVAFEIVPGVSAGLAVPAYAGIPLTHRNYASNVTFVTGHEDPGKPESAIRWEGLVAAGGTLVVFMGVRRMPDVMRSLQSAGMPINTPVAAIQWGTTPMQRTVEGTVSTIVAEVERHGLDHPALMVIGRAVEERATIAWFDRRPLWLSRVLVTRAKEQAPPLVEALREVGAGVASMAVLAFEAPEDSSEIAPALADLTAGKFDWIVYTSANAVRSFHDQMAAKGLDLRAYAGVKIATVGPATAQALRNRGLNPDLIPTDARAEGLLEAIKEADTVRGQRFLLPRAEVARNVLPDALRVAGGLVDVVPVYRTVCPSIDEESAVRHVKVCDTVTFTSPSAFRNLVAVCGGQGHDLLENRTVVAIGPITARAIEKAGLKVDVVAPTPTVQALVDALVEHTVARRSASQ
jgi:uroporphyrinogen III methyltransferase/synthase